MKTGIEAINVYCGLASMDIRTLFEARKLDTTRFDNLIMNEKSVGLPCEDPVTNAVNAAAPLLDAMSEDDRKRIDMVITATESGLDFGKSLSTYIHDYLKLDKRCRLFEIKQACYGATAALQMAANYVVAQAERNPTVLVIATDVARSAAKFSYAEPSQGVSAVAFIVSLNPKILTLDFGANGFHSYEVMDTCRPNPEIEHGDPDLSLMSYLDCLDASYRAYVDTVESADLMTTFDYLAFHTPFAGMVRGAHRNIIRKHVSRDRQVDVDEDFHHRVKPSLNYCSRVGNIYSASLYLALCSLIDLADFTAPRRVGLFSYGSGCSSEFFSGVVNPSAVGHINNINLKQQLDNRYSLTMKEYDHILDLNNQWMFGTRDKQSTVDSYNTIYEEQFRNKNKLILKRIKDYHREYEWS
ncbi:hydroxymethylglutaryl-CoA synthase family protein [Pseudomonadota bacterium]